MRFLIPEGGVSALDAPGQPFHDPDADAALFDGDRGRPYGRPTAGARSACRCTSTIRRSRRRCVENFREIASRREDERMRDAPHRPQDTSCDKFHDMMRHAASRSSAAAPAPAYRAKCEEAGGIDLIVIYNSGRYRMAGRGSLAGLLPYGDANAIVMEMAGEVLPVVKHTPVLAGVCGTDPFG